MLEESLYGRSKEIAPVKDSVQSRTVSVMWITGGPAGSGETTVAKMSAQKSKGTTTGKLFYFAVFKKA